MAAEALTFHLGVWQSHNTVKAWEVGAGYEGYQRPIENRGDSLPILSIIFSAGINNWSISCDF